MKGRLSSLFENSNILYPRKFWQRWTVFIAVTILLPCLLIGIFFSLWYKSDFPMPDIPRQTVVGINFETTARYLDRKQNDLRFWKEGRGEIRNLRLAGTKWEDSYHGLVLNFTENNIVEFQLSKPQRENGLYSCASPFQKSGNIPTFTSMQKFVDSIDGKPYTFHSTANWPSCHDWLIKSCPLNLEIPGSDWGGFIRLTESSPKSFNIFFRTENPKWPRKTTNFLNFRETPTKGP